MHNLKALNQKHDIENGLYHSSTLCIIYDLIGDYRTENIKSENLGNKVSIKEEWMHIIRSLERELRFKEELLLHEKSRQQLTDKGRRESKGYLTKIMFCNVTFVGYMTM